MAFLLSIALSYPPTTPDKIVTNPIVELCDIDTTPVERDRCIRGMIKLMRRGR